MDSDVRFLHEFQKLFDDTLILETSSYYSKRNEFYLYIQTSKCPKDSFFDM